MNLLFIIIIKHKGKAFTFVVIHNGMISQILTGGAGGEAERQVEARAMLREADTNEDGKIR